MEILCKLGFHEWYGCRCGRCGKIRNKEHRWNRGRCTNCGKTSDEEHQWDGCKCTVCGKERDEEHRWDGGKCSQCEKNITPAEIWVEKLLQEENYQDLAGVFNYYSSYDQEKEDRKKYARRALLKAGEKALDAVGEQLVKTIDETPIDILIKTDHKRAVTILLSAFGEVSGGSSSGTDKIVEFFVRIGAVETAPGLVPFLVNENFYIRKSAAYGLGLLGVPETTGALQNALQKYPRSVGFWGLSRSDTKFATSILAEFDKTRKATGPDLKSMKEKDILNILGRFCDELEYNDEFQDNDEAQEQFDVIVRDIGEELYRRGDTSEMKRVLKKLLHRPNYRRIEGIWSGIGSWMG